MVTIIEGKVVAAAVKADLVTRIDALNAQGIIPALRVILIGDDPASASYVKSKEKSAKQLNIDSDVTRLPADIDYNTVANLILDFNRNSKVHGILLQLPVPDHLNADKLIELIAPEKDVDGFHPTNLGLLCDSRPRFVSCTPLGILEMLRRSNIPLSGKHVVILGRSRVVGRPLSLLLSNKGVDATVTVCHSRSENLKVITRSADILIAAIGKAKYVTADMVKEGAVVIDVGVNRVDGQLVGDVDFDKVMPLTSYITPVPGGVGLMTVAMLMANTVLAAENSRTGK